MAEGRSRLLQSVCTAAVEREELLGKQRGEAVGANSDVEACLSAGDHDTDREVPRLRGTAAQLFLQLSTR
jgi:hypothetical protein